MHSLRPHTFCVAFTFVLVLAGCGREEETATTSTVDPELKRSTEDKVHTLAERFTTDARIPLPRAFAILSEYLEQNSEIYGAAFAFADPQDGGAGPRSAPYVYRNEGVLRQKDLADMYDYAAQPWYARPVDRRQPVWSEPYFDEGGGEIWMITFSVPIYVNDRLIGVVTSDLPSAAPQ